MPVEPRICITSGGDEIRLRSYVNHAIYAREHGLDYRLETGIDPHIVTKFDYKVAILRRLLPRYDWLVWMDDDAFFTDFEADNLRRLISEAERDDISLVIAEGPTEPNGFWSRRPSLSSSSLLGKEKPNPLLMRSNLPAPCGKFP